MAEPGSGNTDDSWEYVENPGADQTIHVSAAASDPPNSEHHPKEPAADNDTADSGSVAGGEDDRNCSEQKKDSNSSCLDKRNEKLQGDQKGNESVQDEQHDIEEILRAQSLSGFVSSNNSQVDSDNEKAKDKNHDDSGLGDSSGAGIHKINVDAKCSPSGDSSETVTDKTSVCDSSEESSQNTSEMGSSLKCPSCVGKSDQSLEDLQCASTKKSLKHSETTEVVYDTAKRAAQRPVKQQGLAKSGDDEVVDSSQAEQTVPQQTRNSMQEIECEDTHLLEVLGFKQHCEEKFHGLVLHFNHEKSCFTFQPTSYTGWVRGEFDQFLGEVVHLPLESIDAISQNLLVLRDNARDFVYKQLHDVGIKCSLPVHGGKVGARCKKKDKESCLKVIKDSLQSKHWSVKTNAVAEQIESTVKSSSVAYCETEEKESSDTVVHVAATSDIACDLFKEISQKCESMGQNSGAVLSGSLPSDQSQGGVENSCRHAEQEGQTEKSVLPLGQSSTQEATRNPQKDDAQGEMDIAGSLSNDPSQGGVENPCSGAEQEIWTEKRVLALGQRSTHEATRNLRKGDAQGEMDTAGSLPSDQSQGGVESPCRDAEQEGQTEKRVLPLGQSSTQEATRNPRKGDAQGGKDTVRPRLYSPDHPLNMGPTADLAKDVALTGSVEGVATSPERPPRKKDRKLEEAKTPSTVDESQGITGQSGQKDIDIDPLMSDIFQKSEEIRKDFLYTIKKIGLDIDLGALIKGHVKITNCEAEEDCHKVKAVLEKVFVIEHIDQNTKDELDQEVKAAAEKHKEKFRISCSKKSHGKWTVVYAGIQEDLEHLRFQLKHKTIKMPVPDYMVSHLRQMGDYLGEMTPALKKLEVVVQTEADGMRVQNVLIVTVERNSFPEVEREVNSILEKLVYREEQIKVSTACYLKKKGKEFVKALEKQHCCTINVESPKQQVLLQSWSPCGHQIMVCEGSAVDASVDVVVLPLCDGQKAWPVDHKRFLAEAFLSSSIEMYAKDPVPDQDKILELACNGSRAGQKAVLMSVPSNTDGKFKHRISQSMQSLFKCVAAGSAVALPLSLNAGMTKKYVKHLLHCIAEIFDDASNEIGNIQLKLCTDRTGSLSSASCCEEMDKYLTQRGWTTSGLYKYSPRSDQRVQVVVGEIHKWKAEVLVNSTDPDLKHNKGLVSCLLLEQAGEPLRKQCEDLYPGGMKENIVAVTEGFEVSTFSSIFHIALDQNHWKDDMGHALLEDLKVRVQSCLTLASAKQFKSIVFPTLGTGKLRYPPDRAAQTMLTAIHNFFCLMPHSSLHHVYICCYSEEDELIRAFKTEEVLHRYGLGSPLHSAASGDLRGAWFTVEKKSFFMGTGRKSLLQIIAGDALDHYRTDDKVICASCNAGEQWQKLHQLQGICPVYSEKSIKDDIRRILDEIEDLSTVHIILHTFGRTRLTDVLKGLEKGLSAHHVVLVVPREDFNDVFEAATGVWKQRPTYYSVGDSSAVDENASVQICGAKQQVETVMEKINEMNISTTKTSQRVPASDQPADPEDPQDDKEREQVNEDPLTTSQVSGLCSFSFPLEGLAKEDVDRLLGTPELSRVHHTKEQQPSHCIRFWVHRQELASKVEHVNNFIAEYKNQPVVTNVSQPPPQSQPQPVQPLHNSVSREVNPVSVKALEVLMKEDFDKFKTEQKDDTTVTITCSGPSAEELMGKVDMLRQEEVGVAQSDFEKIPSPFDTTSEGAAAYFVPVPDQGRVLIFTFDYSALSKAKHMLNIKLGRVKTTSRAHRKFDGSSDKAGSGIKMSPPVMAVTSAESTTKSGIKVSVYKTDITKLPVDAIANAANEHLSHGGGVAYAISRAAGFDLEDECQDYLRGHGPLEVMGVVPTTAGSLPCKKVLHAVGPRWSDYQDKGVCQQHLTDTVYNCLQQAEAVQAQSIALPSISSAIFGVPKEVCARSYLSAVQKFDKLHGVNTCVRHIHFVDVNDDMISVISQTFTLNWDVDHQPLHTKV